MAEFYKILWFKSIPNAHAFVLAHSCPWCSSAFQKHLLHCQFEFTFPYTDPIPLVGFHCLTLVGFASAHL